MLMVYVSIKKNIYIYNLGKECESVSVEHIDLLPYTEKRK